MRNRVLFGVCVFAFCCIALFACGFLSPAAAFAVSAPNPQTLYISQAQVVALPSKSGNEALLVTTIVFHNATGAPAAVAIPLPQGVSAPALLNASVAGWRLLQGNQVADARLPVGNTAVILSMRIALAGQAADLTWEEPYHVRELFVVIPEGSLMVSAQGGFLTGSETFVARGVTFRRFTKLDLQPNTAWTLAFSLLPTANGRQATPLPGVPVLNAYSHNSVDLEALANLLLAGAILVVGMISIRGTARKTSSALLHKKSTQSAILAAREKMMVEWTDLELRFQKGTIAEAEYLDKRAQRKKAVMDLDSSLREGWR